MTTNEELIGRAELDDLTAILSVSNTDIDEAIHAVADNAEAIFTWDYEKGRRPALNRLYEKAKRSQWNGEVDLPWDTDVDQEAVVVNNAVQNMGGMMMGIDQSAVDGTPFATWDTEEWIQLGVQSQNWTLSQFMHGEQGALLCTAKIVETVPWIDAKYYASTQVMDEARHVEVFARYLDTKLSGHYPINAHLKLLLDDIVNDSRWDMTYLGMQIMVEGLALAAFGFIHQITTEPLLKQLLRYVMSDEARHVAFGVLSLKEYYAELTDAELAERQEFAFEAAVRMRDRFLQQEVWDGPRRVPGAAAGDGVAPAGDVPVAAVLQDRAQLQEAGPPRRQRRLAAGQVHRAGRDRLRGQSRHRRGVRHVPAGGGRDRGLTRGRPAYARRRWTASTTWAACTASGPSSPRPASPCSTSRGRVGSSAS